MLKKGKYYYELEFENKGGLPMPIIFNFEYEDGTKETKRIPAEIWRKGDVKVRKAFAVSKKVKRIVLDPYHETADVDRTNNFYPPEQEVDRFELFEFKQNQVRENPMQRANRIKDNRL